MNWIDWPGLARNALWIGGLSVALAAWSHAGWLAARRGARMRQALGWPILQAPFAAGMVLFAAGQAWGADRIWERILWIVLAVAFVWQAYDGWRGAADRGWSGGDR